MTKLAKEIGGAQHIIQFVDKWVKHYSKRKQRQLDKLTITKETEMMWLDGSKLEFKEPIYHSRVK